MQVRMGRKPHQTGLPHIILTCPSIVKFPVDQKHDANARYTRRTTDYRQTHGLAVV